VIPLVFIDVDGTLVGSDGSVHPRVWDACAEARLQGVRLAISSGRPGFGITRDMAARLDPDGWHIFQNGASIVHLGNGDSRSTPLPVAAAESLIARARDVGRLIEVYADDNYAWEGPPERARAHAELLGIPFEPRPIDRLKGKIVRAQYLIAHEETESVTSEPHEGLEVSGSTSPVMPDTRFLNYTAAGVTKASAVKAVVQEYGLDLADVMFVGDGWNDAQAMRAVGWPVAMGNAEAEARAAARYTVGHVDHGGLADAIALTFSR
jgi:Cof subfamily protein (haloacid dehalogenase superfamily)